MRTYYSGFLAVALTLAIAGCSLATQKTVSSPVNKFTSLSTPTLTLDAGPSFFAVDKANKNDVRKVNFVRSDGKPSEARLYSPAQIVRRGNHLVFTEYLPAEKIAKGKDTSNNILYPLGGSIRSFYPGQEIKTVFRSKGIDGSKRAVRAIAFDGNDIILSRGNAIWRLDEKSGRTSAIAGSLNQAGNRDGIGSQARFAFSIAMVRDGRNIYIADRENMSIRKLNLDSGRVSTYLELPFKPQGLILVGNKLWIAGSDLQSVDLSCQENCQTKIHRLWPGMRAISSSITSDYRGGILVNSEQGLFRYQIASGASERLASYSQSFSTDGQAGKASPNGEINVNTILTANGIAVLGNKLYFINSSNIGSMPLPAS